MYIHITIVIANVRVDRDINTYDNYIMRVAPYFEDVPFAMLMCVSSLK